MKNYHSFTVSPNGETIRFNVGGIIFHVNRNEVFFPYSELEIEVVEDDYSYSLPVIVITDKRQEHDYSKEEYEQAAREDLEEE